MFKEIKRDDVETLQQEVDSLYVWTRFDDLWGPFEELRMHRLYTLVIECASYQELSLSPYKYIYKYTRMGLRKPMDIVRVAVLQ